jgi:lipopolysaccharide heptosyltransferase I
MGKNVTAMAKAQQIAARSSILIILMGSIGDVARGISLVSHLKAHLPKSRITWLVEPICAELVRLHPQIDKVVVFNRSWRLTAIRDLYNELRQNYFDITLDLQRHLKSGIFSLLSWGKRRIGFHRKNAKELNWVFNNEHIGYYPEELPKLEHYFKFTAYLGLPDPLDVDFGLSEFDAYQHLPPTISELQQPVVAVLLGSRWESKDWFVDAYRKLVQHILTIPDLRVVLIGDQSQRSNAHQICDNIPPAAIINLVGKTSLVELTAVLQSAQAAVGPDSGPGHLAAAVGTPYVTLFGPTSPQRTAPYGSRHLVVQTQLECIPCYKKRCPEHTKQCMRDIRVEDVIEKLSAALKTGMILQQHVPNG